MRVNDDDDSARQAVQKLLHLTTLDRLKWKKIGNSRYSYSTPSATAIISKESPWSPTVFTMVDSDGDEISRLGDDSPIFGGAPEVGQLWEAITSQTTAAQKAIKDFLADLEG